MGKKQKDNLNNQLKVKLSIRTVLMSGFFIVLAVTLLIISGGAFIKFKGIMELNTEKNIQVLTEEIESSVSTYLSHYTKSIDTLALSSDVIHILQQPELTPNLLNRLDQLVKTDPDILFFYMGTENGQMLMKPDDDLGPDYNPRERDWYKFAKTQKGTVWTEPYFDETVSQMVVSACRAVYDEQGQLVGVIALDLALDAINQNVNKLKIGEKGYMVLLDSNNVIISHHDPKKVGTPLETKALLDALTTPENKTITYQYEEDGKTNKKLGVIRYTAENNWRIIGTYYLDEIDKEVFGFITFIGICGLCALILSIIIISFFTNRFSGNIKHLARSMQIARTGDLSVRSSVKSKDEIGLLSKFFDETIADLGDLVSNVQGVSSELTLAAQNLAATSEEVSASADEVAKTVEDIAKGAEDQANDAEASAGTSRDLSIQVSQLEQITKAMLNAAKSLNTANQTSYEAIQNLNLTNEHSNAANVQIGQSVSELSLKTSEISGILDAISAISVQTNLLALNASIEAARAGEHGRGFAVVAEEIRKLAEASAQSADEVRGIVGNIIADSKKTVSHMETLKNNTEAQNLSVTDVYNAFNTIGSAYDEIAIHINGIENSVNQLSISQEHIHSSIENISAVSEETAAAAEEVTASMDQQVFAVEEVAKAAQRLNEISSHLNQQISHFKI